LPSADREPDREPLVAQGTGCVLFLVLSTIIVFGTISYVFYACRTVAN
jgi:hypothetical protein